LYLYKALYQPDGQGIAVSAGPNVILWQPDARERLSLSFDTPVETVRSVAFSPDSTQLAAASQDGSLALVDAATGNSLWQYTDQNGSGWLSTAFSPDGSMLVAGNEDGNVYVFDTKSGQLLQTLTGHTNWVLSVAVSPDGTKIASGSSDSSVRLWDVQTVNPIGSPLTGQTGDIWAVAFSPDSKILASGSHDPTVQLWDVETGERLGEPLAGHTDAIYALAFSPDGKLLASGGGDMTAILWDVGTQTPVAELTSAHTDSIFSLAFSPDSKTLASGGADGSIILWDVATYKPIVQPFVTEPDWVDSLAFSPDGTMLAAGIGGSDGVAHQALIWKLNAPDGAEIACQIAGRNLTWDEWTRYIGDVPYQRTCPELPIHYSVIDALGRQANAADLAGNTDAAQAFYEQAAEWAVGSGAAGPSNNLCWFGSLNGYAEAVMPACDYAVEASAGNANYVDSRGLARALTGDTEGAIADFQVFLDWTLVYGSYDTFGVQRAEWITRLTAGENPFDEATLKELKAQ
jgi:WD40 repeat protein